VATFKVRAYCENDEAFVYEIQVGDAPDTSSKVTGEAPHMPDPEHDNPVGHSSDHTVRDFTVVAVINDPDNQPDGNFYKPTHEKQYPANGHIQWRKWYENYDSETHEVSGLAAEIVYNRTGGRLISEVYKRFTKTGAVHCTQTTNYHTVDGAVIKERTVS